MTDFETHPVGTIAAKDAEISSLRAEVERLREAIHWACGERGDFPIIDGPPYYRWRTKLRELSGVGPDDKGRDDEKECPECQGRGYTIMAPNGVNERVERFQCEYCNETGYVNES